MVEYIDVCNKDGSNAGYSVSRKEIHEKGLFHRVVHIWIVDSNGMVLVQKRSMTKESNPGMWDISCAGHIDAGDSSKTTAIRELFEELGLLYSENDLEFLFSYNKTYICGNYIDNELPDVYLITLSHPFNLTTLKFQDEEVSDAKLVTIPELYTLVSGPTFASLGVEGEPIEKSPYNKLFKVLSERFPENK